ncbi:hypothetical protein OIDMADRAFT_25534 [Oidiodendron maius Zn]|uniref:Uncharacterized protein n=1 Tax=Oidiodendron maius (strain Zn) TaxID=913774 RepID=A0A0C3HPH8_OIDMZ|nr:hypothetical protein OIDMADRAFT_25534 [Oidiodendron maius Zn]
MRGRLPDDRRGTKLGRLTCYTHRLAACLRQKANRRRVRRRWSRPHSLNQAPREPGQARLRPGGCCGADAVTSRPGRGRGSAHGGGAYRRGVTTTTSAWPSACGRRGHLAALSGLNMMQVALLTSSIPRTLPEPNADQDAAARWPGRRALVRRDVSPSQERAGTRQAEGVKDGMTVWCEATHEGHIGRDKGWFATKPDSRRRDPLDRGWSIWMRSIGSSS